MRIGGFFYKKNAFFPYFFGFFRNNVIFIIKRTIIKKMITYIGYIALFLIIYPFIKKGFEEVVCDITIGITYIIALIIRLYYKIKKWTKRITD